MRLLILLLCLSCVAYGQEATESTPINRLREQYRRLMTIIYQRADVVAFCEKNPQGEINVRVNGEESMFLVDCVAWKAHKALVEAGVR